MNVKQDAKNQRINALEQLVAVLRRQQEGMKRSLRDKDGVIEMQRRQIDAITKGRPVLLLLQENGEWSCEWQPTDTPHITEPI